MNINWEDEKMVNLKEIPYCLSDEDIAWVERTIGEMSDEEKTLLNGTNPLYNSENE